MGGKLVKTILYHSATGQIEERKGVVEDSECMSMCMTFLEGNFNCAVPIKSNPHIFLYLFITP